MNIIGNILWFVLIGLWTSILWALFGVLWCITIVGIPVGLQCFKFASLSAFPFGKDVEISSGGVSTFINILWILFGGIELAISYLVAGLIFFITIVGIPFGVQCMKLVRLSLLPMGAKIVHL